MQTPKVQIHFYFVSFALFGYSLKIVEAFKENIIVRYIFFETFITVYNCVIFKLQCLDELNVLFYISILRIILLALLLLRFLYTF